MTEGEGGGKILVVEDEEYLRDLYREVLEKGGLVVETAADGEEAYNKMKNGGYKLVLLDLLLPKMSGVEILRRLAAETPGGIKEPVVVLTNMGQDEAIAECTALGARGYFTKVEMDPGQLLTEVKKIVGGDQGR